MATRGQKTIKIAKEMPEDCLPTCGTCNAFVSEPGDDEWGECHANPPTPILIEDASVYAFPVVPSKEWCRKWERKTH